MKKSARSVRRYFANFFVFIDSSKNITLSKRRGTSPPPPREHGGWFIANLTVRIYKWANDTGNLKVINARKPYKRWFNYMYTRAYLDSHNCTRAACWSSIGHWSAGTVFSGSVHVWKKQTSLRRPSSWLPVACLYRADPVGDFDRTPGESSSV